MGEVKKRSSSWAFWLGIIATLLWMAVIFRFSAQNSVQSSEFSSRLLKKVLKHLWPHWSTLTVSQHRLIIQKLHVIFRKLGHFSEYAVLGGLFSFTMPKLGRSFGKDPGSLFRFLLPALLALIYAVTDELHQKFVGGRSCELRDVCIDLSGAVLGILLANFIGSLRRKIKQKNQLKGDRVHAASESSHCSPP